MAKSYIQTTDEFGIRDYRTSFLAFLSLSMLYFIITIFSFALLAFESGSEGANITNYSDAFWTLQMSASTIGFGDHYPVSLGGRVIVAAMFYIGVGLVGFIGALIADKVLGFADTNVKNRELRKQNTEILEHNKLLEQKIDRLLNKIENDLR